MLLFSPSNDKKIKRRFIEENWTAFWWWLRSPNINTTSYFSVIYDNGNNVNTIASSVGGVCFGFCI